MVNIIKIAVLGSILSMASWVELLSDPWEVYKNPNTESNLIRTVSPVQHQGDIYFATENNVFRYSEGNLTTFGDSLLESWVEHYYFRYIQVDESGTIIAINNKGYAIKYENGWEYFDQTNAKYVQYANGMDLINDTIVISTAGRFIQYLVPDSENATYSLMTDSIVNINDQTNKGVGSKVVDYKGSRGILYLSFDDLAFLDLETMEIRSIQDDLSLDFPKIDKLGESWETENSLAFSVSRNDTTAALLVFDKNNIENFSVTSYDPKPTPFLSADVGGYSKFENGYFLALNDQLYYYDESGDRRKIKPPSFIQGGEQVYYSALENFENDTLFAFTLNHGFFKAYIPDLLDFTSVEEPARQWGINQLESMEVYPNPASTGSIIIKLYVGLGQTRHLTTEVYDIEGELVDLGLISYSNLVGNFFSAELRTETLQPGIYFVRHSDPWGEATSKFIIK